MTFSLEINLRVRSKFEYFIMIKASELDPTHSSAILDQQPTMPFIRKMTSL